MCTHECISVCVCMCVCLCLLACACMFVCVNACTIEYLIIFFEILSDLNQAVPNHLADESQTRWPDTPPDHPPFIGVTVGRCWCSNLPFLSKQLLSTLSFFSSFFLVLFEQKSEMSLKVKG